METLFTLFIAASVALLLYALTRSDLVGTRSDIAGAAGIMWYPTHYPGGAPFEATMSPARAGPNRVARPPKMMNAATAPIRYLATRG